MEAGEWGLSCSGRRPAVWRTNGGVWATVNDERLKSPYQTRLSLWESGGWRGSFGGVFLLLPLQGSQRPALPGVS